MFKNLTGELNNPGLEADFLEDAWPRMRWQYLIVIGACLLGIAFMIAANLTDPRLSSHTKQLLAMVRLAQFAATAACFGICWSRSRPASLPGIIALTMLATVLTENANFMLATLPKLHGAPGGTPFLVVLLFVFYTLIPNRFTYTMAIGLFSLVTEVMVSYADTQALDQASYVFIMFLFVNVLGIGYGRHINKLQRQDFVRRKEIEAEITRRRAAERDALAQTELAEKVSTEKSRFLAVAGHDLRQPLHALGLWVDSLRDKLIDQDIDAALRLADRVVAAKDGLGDLMERLLHVSHLDAGIRNVDIAPVAVDFVLEDMATRFNLPAHKQAIRFKTISSGVTVLTDPLLLNRMLDNLVDNAIKYGRRGGRVTVGVRRGSGRAKIQVWNEGLGIPATEHADIFESFQRGKRHRASSLRGMGLGLSIVKRLAELLGHTIAMQSEPDGLTMFEIELPTTRRSASHYAKSRPSDSMPLDLTILIIDDDSEVREAMSLLLERWGATTMICGDRAGAGRCVETRKPDLILTDYDLGEDDNGIAIVSWLGETYQLTCPTIILTGDTTADSLTHISHSGLACLNKPVKPAQLRTTIQLQTMHSGKGLTIDSRAAET